MRPGLFERTRTAPSGYEEVRLLFHGIRTAQLVSSIIVGGIMCYFMYYLAHGHWAIPWTFIVLLVVSLLTVAFLTATIIFHFLTGLSPKLNLGLNTVLFVLWAMGFSMLSYWMTETVRHHCDVANWQDGTGIMVCRIYKALFSFSLLGLFSTICALALDIHIHRLSTRLGTHMRLDALNGGRDLKRSLAIAGPYTDIDAPNAAALDHDEEDEFPSRHSDAFEVPQKGYFAAPTVRKEHGQEGYAVPEGQFDYDTGYHGGHAERVFGST